jgi:hypothetical protein
VLQGSTLALDRVTDVREIIDAFYLFMNFAKNAEFSSSSQFPSNEACIATRISRGCNQVNIDARYGLEFRGLTIWKLSAVALFWNHTSRSCFIRRDFFFRGYRYTEPRIYSYMYDGCSRAAVSL